MKNISLVVDLDMCTGCFACQNACKLVNDLDVDVKWLKVTPEYLYPEKVGDKLYMDRFPVPVSLDCCESCPDRADGSAPLCAKVCMGHALYVGDSTAAGEWAQGRRTVAFAA
ncbi:MAG: hypothetical protein LBR39_05710 [Coriobacteriales bacterium]|jgi:Fe-S-cluster-containing dehydrogenase component|nr:hypothetical protein [Coriobacteriales bacterium]